MKARLLFSLTTLLLALSSWANGVKIDGIYYELDSSTRTAMVTYSGHSPIYPNSDATAYKGNITIPASVTYSLTAFRVTSIGDYAFRDCTGLTSISIPSSVTSIGYDAFSRCTGLKSLTIPASVTYIGGSAFYGCTGLTSINIPSFVTSIGMYAFKGCTGLTSINIPASVAYIGTEAFKDCSSLASIKVEAGNTAYDSRENCNAIIETASNTLVAGCMNTTIPNSVTKIGDNAFCGCTGLKSISIPASVTKIGDYAFCGCTGLTSISISSSVTSIGDRTFYQCTSLTSINIPASVTYIGNGAFIYCTGLTSISIPASVTSIGGSAFRGCTGLTSINIPASVKYIGSSAFYGCTGLTSISISASVTSIEEHAFHDCTGLTSINIPASVIAIGDHAFNGCTSLTSLNIPASVKYIGSSAFYGCNGLTSINIPASVTSIGDNAFWGCTGLTSISIPSSVTSIEWNAFYGCTGLTDIYALSTYPAAYNCSASAFYGFSATLHVPIGSKETYAATAPWSNFKNIVEAYGVEIDGIYYLLDSSTKTAMVTSTYPNPVYKGNITIPASATYDGTTYTVASIGMNAFRGCTGLTSIDIPASVIYIGSSAFYGCTGLTSISIPASVTKIGDYAFRGCTGLTSITIPASVTSIGISAFSGCTGLTSLNIPNSVTSIGQEAFRGCTGLKSLTIPASVTKIGDFAFYECSGLTDIYAFRTDPAAYKCPSSAFNKVSATLHVPIGRKEAYAAIAPWSNFKNIVEAYGVEIDGIYYLLDSSTKTAMVTSTYPNPVYKGNITIPASATYDGTTYTVASIGMNAFRGCTGLASISIPSSVTYIGSSAFYGCTGLTDIYALRTDPAAYNCSAYAFYEVSATLPTLHVPNGSKEAYTATVPWCFFQNIVEYDASGIEPLCLTPTKADAASYYNLQGQRIARPQRGQIVIQRNADGTGRKVLVK